MPEDDYFNRALERGLVKLRVETPHADLIAPAIGEFSEKGQRREATMMSSSNLRLLAEAIDRTDAAEKYVRGAAGRPPPDGMLGVRVDWPRGFCDEGAKVVAAVVSEIVQEQWEALAFQALERLRQRQKDATVRVVASMRGMP